MKVHIKFITMIICAILVINCLSFGIPVFAAAPSVGIPVGVGISLPNLPEDIYQGFKDAYNMFVNDIFAGSSSFSYEDYDGATKTATASAVKSQGLSIIDSGKVMYDSDGDGKISLVYYDEASRNNRFVDFTLEEYSKFLSSAEVVIDVDDYNGENVVSFFYSMSVYDTSLKNVQSEFLVGSGTSSGVSWGLDMINGVPHNKVEISSPLSVPCFDYLDLNYGCTTNFNDPIIDIIRDPLTNRYDSKYSFYYFFVITSDKTLYCLTSYLDLYRSNRMSYTAYDNKNSGRTIYNFSLSGSFVDDYQYRIAFRFLENSYKLYPSLYFSYNTGGISSLKRYQATFGKPALDSMFNLFSYENFRHEGTPNLYFDNFDYSLYTDTLDTFFYSPLTKEYITSEELLKKDISLIGYFGSNSDSNFTLLYYSSNMLTAGTLLPTYDTLFTGGSTSTTSPLSDWQKAIYILSQQYGESYEELLAKLDMIIDSQGNVTIVGADGIEYKVDELSKTFDEIYSKVDDIASSTSELLEYLKSLNIESLGDLISALEGTLNDLNERDKERDAVYDDMLGKLEELNNRVGSLNLDDLKSISTDISDIKDLINDGIKVGEIDIDDIQNNIETSFFIEKFPFSLPFDLYRLITLFVRDPVEPVFKVPIKTEITAFGLNESIDEEITLDLTMFKINGVDIVRVVLNFSITVGFIVMLIKSTTKLFV